MTTSFSFSPDLATPAVAIAAALSVAIVITLAIELRRSRSRAALPVALSGILATLALLAAILRPARVETDGIEVGPRVVVLVDRSRSMLLPGDSGVREQVAKEVTKTLAKRQERLRIARFGFGAGAAFGLDEDNVPIEASRGRLASQSDLVAAIESLQQSGEEPPRAIIVVSDGRLDRPSALFVDDRGALGLTGLGVPVHTVRVAETSLPDASIRNVHVAGAAVAHQPLALRVEIGCSGGLVCDKLPVVVRELRDEGAPEVLARGDAAPGKDASVTIELSATLHRAGSRVIEIGLESPSGDRVPDNDRRFVSIDVARDRVRILHIAGRPTYDVRALRTYLKSDESIDVVAFFILRTPTDNVGASPSELALIPFPVDELFSVHLPSFDAVVLQDFNAEVYGLTKHLDNLANYVSKGGGLIMVGGPDAFGPGQYAGTALADVLPAKLTREHETKGIDLGWFVPELTQAGRLAPVLGPLRDVIGETFPEMPGTNLVGKANPGATVLLTHPKLASDGEPMPVLALGEHGTGRTIALTVDGTHRLLFSAFAAERAGRAYGALWDGLLGWLMRDPRFESTSIDVSAGCVAGEPTELVVRALPGAEGDLKMEIMRLGSKEKVFETSAPLSPDGKPLTVTVPPLAPGGYAASVQLGRQASGQSKSLTPATRRDFACEKGGNEWADSRPDTARLQAIAKTSGGISVTPDKTAEIPLPEATMISTQRKTLPLLPAWALSGLAALLLGTHWILRRRSGLV